MRQKEADTLAIILLDLKESFDTAVPEGSKVIANVAIRCIAQIEKEFPMINESMLDLEVLRMTEGES